MNELYEIDDLIAKVLTDEATDVEQTELNRWLNESPKNQNYFEDLKRIWTQSNDAADTLDVNTDKAWTRVQEHIHQPPKKLIVTWFSTINIMKIAAVVLILFGVMKFFDGSSTLKNQEITTVASVSNDTLSDGSRVTLNKKSSLTTVFSKKERHVKMSGEVFFDVAHDTEKPFVIEVKTLKIKVVGTSFNVDNLSDIEKIIVVVETGKVLLRGANGSEIYLEKEDKAIYNLTTGQFERAHSTDKNVVAYKTNRLDFDKTTLSDAVKQINQLFDSHIEIASPSIENCLIHSTYTKGDDLEFYFKEIIGESIDLTFERVGDKIILKGTGCKD